MRRVRLQAVVRRRAARRHLGNAGRAAIAPRPPMRIYREGSDADGTAWHGTLPPTCAARVRRMAAAHGGTAHGGGGMAAQPSFVATSANVLRPWACRMRRRSRTAHDSGGRGQHDTICPIVTRYYPITIYPVDDSAVRPARRSSRRGRSAPARPCPASTARRSAARREAGQLTVSVLTLTALSRSTVNGTSDAYQRAPAAARSRYPRRCRRRASRRRRAGPRPA